jgi:hypothetical protein
METIPSQQVNRLSLCDYFLPETALTNATNIIKPPIIIIPKYTVLDGDEFEARIAMTKKNKPIKNITPLLGVFVLFDSLFC